ncbi:MAG: hypothetical protein HY928_13475 [Elusimicrobia bacterium]|nr:hypothetical protein [Elusimicrobiota bacterium]
MTRGWWARLAAICAAAFVLRAGIAVVDARRPLFPEFYYYDERDYLRTADELARGESRGAMTPGKEAYTMLLVALHGPFGSGPLPGRLTNAAFGAGAAGAWGWTAASVAGPPAGLAAAAFLALWPSNAFHSAQAIKEAPTSLLLALCAALMCAGFGAQGRRRNLLFLAAALSALALGFLRSQLLPVAAAAGAAAGTAAWVRAPRGGKAAAAAAAFWLLLPLLAYRPIKAALQQRLGSQNPEYSANILPELAPPAAEPGRTPTALQRISTYRRNLLGGVIAWSVQMHGRTPDSALWPEVEFRSWPELALFIPKAAFFELFMPLPGLYPLQGKPSRMLAAAEGLVLLVTALFALPGLCGRERDPAALFLLVFFLLAVPGTAFLEFDLGSASRHRIHWIPFILPFAAAFAVSPRRGRP